MHHSISCCRSRTLAEHPRPEHSGEAQARVYAETLSTAMEALTGGPTVIGAKARNEIAKGLFTLHVARQGRKGRHLPRHLPPMDKTE